MDEEEKEIDEGSLKIDDNDMDMPPEGMEDDFGSDDPDDKYH